MDIQKATQIQELLINLSKVDASVFEMDEFKKYIEFTQIISKKHDALVADFIEITSVDLP